MRFAVFGEILWDINNREDGTKERTIGGAPFNLAAHASRLGADVHLISAVGDDGSGREALDWCSTYGIDTSSVAITGRPTGTVQVTLKDGMPSYDIVAGVAYDDIPVPWTLPEADVFCFGTLAQRDQHSAATLDVLLDHYRDSIIFCDINIRQNFYNSEILERSVRAAKILKISREEAGVFGMQGSLEEICRQLLASYPNLDLILMTLGSDGAFAASGNGEIIYSSAPSCKVVSTVGAGDSFSAGFLVSYLAGAGIERSLENAVTLASFVCGNVGAVCEYPDELKAVYSTIL